MKHPNELVQMDTKGPFYLKGSRNKHYFIHVIDDCSRKVVSKWCNRRNSEKALSVLKEWIELYGKPMKVMHDGGREFTSNKFKNYLVLNGIIDKQIPKGYPQEQGKVEAYNKIVIAEFLQVEELIDEKDGIEKYESFVNSYNYEREHGGINGMTPSEKFMNLKTTDIDTLKQDKRCQSCWYIVLSTMSGSTTVNNRGYIPHKVGYKKGRKMIMMSARGIILSFQKKLLMYLI